MLAYIESFTGQIGGVHMSLELKLNVLETSSLVEEAPYILFSFFRSPGWQLLASAIFRPPRNF